MNYPENLVGMHSVRESEKIVMLVCVFPVHAVFNVKLSVCRT